MISETEAALALLHSAFWLASCHRDVPQTLVAEGRLERLAAGAWIQTEGETDTGLVVLVRGSADFFAQGRHREPVHLGQVIAGTAWGHTPQFVGGGRLLSMICSEPCVVLRVPAAALSKIASRHPEIWQAIATLLFLQLRNAVQWGVDMVGLGPRARIAARLLATARYGRAGAVLQMSQQSLAETVGLTRKTVNLHLADLQRDGVVRLEYGRIHLLDMERLRELSRS